MIVSKQTQPRINLSSTLRIAVQVEYRTLLVSLLPSFMRTTSCGRIMTTRPR
jgi:hypothetical protein